MGKVFGAGNNCWLILVGRPLAARAAVPQIESIPEGKFQETARGEIFMCIVLKPTKNTLYT